jgi:2-polyprenyl-3-methyl-5-hydroxy-6-metoxy-1,4-benzoquinol methylase
MTRAPVATQYSYEFVRRHLPASASSILEIGCGRGELAARLRQESHQVLAIDSDADCVAEARKFGIEAEVANWPADIAASFDAVLFTRSLHHIHELEQAVEAALAKLNAGGCIIVEDFRAEARPSDRMNGLPVLSAGSTRTARFATISILRRSSPKTSRTTTAMSFIRPPPSARCSHSSARSKPAMRLITFATWNPNCGQRRLRNRSWTKKCQRSRTRQSMHSVGASS